MKLPKNYIIEDPYKALVDGDKGSDFRNAVDGVTGGDYVMFVVGKSEDVDDSVERVQKAIGEETAEGKLKNYAILTDRPAEWNAQFISNNVIDVRGKTSRQIADEIAWVFSDFGKRDGMNENIFIIGDCHFFHKNIIKYCNRPWNEGYDSDGKIIVTDENVKQMNEDLIKNWNLVVKKNDIIYVNGDFCFGNKEKVKSIVDRLNGKKRLILGNHDNLRINDYYDAGFERVYDKKIIINDYIILSHTPLEFLNDNCPFFCCYAHVHDSEMYKTFTKTSCCTSVERHNYTPISLKYIQQKVNALD